MVNWLVENWYFVYFPLHAFVGILLWGWFHYSLLRSYEKKFGIINFRLHTLNLLLGWILSIIMGPFVFVAVLSCHFDDNPRLRWGLKFF